MNKRILYVGLDYHYDVVQVCVMDGEGQVLRNRYCPNCWQEVESAVGACGARVRAAIEACSGAADLAEELLGRAGWSVALAHPGYVARMKQNPDKTDYGDARMLADLERVGYLPRVWLAPQEVRELRRLVRYRQGLVKERRTLKQRVGALVREQRLRGPEGVRRWTKAWLKWLAGAAALSEQGRWVVERHLARLGAVEDEIKTAETRLTETVRDDPVVARLGAQKGIGLVTACVLRSEIGRFDRFHSGKQLSRFCGLSPRNASSGARQADAGLIEACSHLLRATIIEAAHRLMRWEGRWRDLAVRLVGAGKPKSVVAAAVGNRWMRALYHEMKSFQVTQP